MKRKRKVQEQYIVTHIVYIVYIYTCVYINVTRRGERVLRVVISKHCRAESYLSNDIKYVRIGQILTKLQTSEHTTVGTHNREMANYLLFIDIYKGELINYDN